MAIIIVSILIICYILIATERLTNVNKAAIAIFAGTVGWVLYIGYGTDFVMNRHEAQYLDGFLHGTLPTSGNVKEYIWREIFLPVVGRCSEIVLFLLATMTIVEILHNNGCFDFLTMWMRTRNSRVLMWKLATFTFLVSANLDNISTTVMMLTLMNTILPRSKDRIVYGAVVVLAANFGGALTVIGDPTSLVLWNKGAITATNYTFAMFLPCVVGWALPTYLISRGLSETVQLDHPSMPYRGDDTNLKVWQRFLLFVVGIGGIWFIPTFHNITRLSPFLGAFCVLSILWVVNEIFNRNIMASGRRVTRSIPQQLQYSIIQLMLYVMGIMLAVTAVDETGVFDWVVRQVDCYILCDFVWVLGVISGVASLFLERFATTVTMIEMFDFVGTQSQLAEFAKDGIFWRMISYCTIVGSSIFGISSVAGIVYLQTERVGVSWYFRHVGMKVIPAGIIGCLLLWLSL